MTFKYEFDIVLNRRWPMKYKIRHDLKLNLGYKVLYRIERITTGELGGYIENESNLSQEGNAWVSDNAQVSGTAQVSGDANIYDKKLVKLPRK